MSRKNKQDESTTEYHTPAWAIRPIIPILRRAMTYAPYVVVDAGCGDGAILAEMANAFTAKAFGFEIIQERALRAQSNVPGAQVFAHDFFNLRVGGDGWAETPDLLVMNPPFEDSLRWAAHALDLVAPRRGVVAMLNRIGFLETPGRRPFHEAHPSDVHVLERRCNFRPGQLSPKTGKKQAGDSAAYAWFLWGPGLGGRWSILECEPSVRAQKRRERLAAA